MKRKRSWRFNDTKLQKYKDFKNNQLLNNKNYTLRAKFVNSLDSDLVKLVPIFVKNFQHEVSALNFLNYNIRNVKGVNV